MKKATILTLALLLTAATMASAGDFSTDAGTKGDVVTCLGPPTGFFATLLGLSCGDESQDTKPPQPSDDSTDGTTVTAIKSTGTKR